MADTTAAGIAKKLGPFILFIVVAMVLVLGYYFLVVAGKWRIIRETNPVNLWLGVIVMMAIFLIYAGYQVNGRWLGVLIDPRYKMSLSHLQLTLWTVLGLSAFLTIAVPRILGRMEPVSSVKADDPLLKKCAERLKAEHPEIKTVTVEECDAGPLQILFPPELLLAMGISTASFAGSSLIQSTKKKKEVNIEANDAAVAAAKEKRRTAEQALQEAKAALSNALEKKNKTQKDKDDAEAKVSAATTPEAKAAAQQDLAYKQAQTLNAAAAKAYQEAAASFEAAEAEFRKADEEFTKVSDDAQKAITEAEGLLHKNTEPSEASWVDLFRGDEIGNYRLIDVSKVQMFFFTIIIVFAYGAAVAALLNAGGTVLKHPLGVELPAFSNSLNTLLGISHAGYLTVKTVDHTKTTS